MAGTETLRSMLNNFINDNTEQAQLDLHDYLTQKMKDVAGLNQAEPLEVDNEDPEELEIIDSDDETVDSDDSSED